jgi:hypothetical protein
MGESPWRSFFSLNLAPQAPQIHASQAALLPCPAGGKGKAELGDP